MKEDNRDNVSSTPIRRTTFRDILARGGVSPEKIDQVENPLPVLYDEVFAIMEKEPRLASYDFYQYMDRGMAASLLDRSEDDFDRSGLVKELRNFEIAVHILGLLARSKHINTRYHYSNLKGRISEFMRYMVPELGFANYMGPDITAAAAIHCGFDYEKPVYSVADSINVANQGYWLLKDHKVLLNALIASI